MRPRIITIVRRKVVTRSNRNIKWNRATPDTRPLSAVKTPSHRNFFLFPGVAWDPGAVEEQLCVGHATADGRVHVQHRGPGRTDSHAAAPRDGRDHRAARVHAVEDVQANGHGHAVHQLPGLGGGAHRRHHRPASGHHSAPLFR